MRDWLNLLGRLPANNGDPKWFESDDGNARLADDRRLLAEKYPVLKFALNFRFQKAVLRGQIILKEENSGVPTAVKIQLIFPDNYPETEPAALDDGNRFPHINDRHFYTNGACCLWLPFESQWEQKNRNSLLNFVDQVALFFERQLIYDASGVWAWGQRGHGEAGYIEFLEEQLGGNLETIQIFLPLLTGKTLIHKKSKCPCKSHRPYDGCHKQKVDSIKRRIGGLSR